MVPILLLESTITSKDGTSHRFCSCCCCFKEVRSGCDVCLQRIYSLLDKEEGDKNPPSCERLGLQHGGLFNLCHAYVPVFTEGEKFKRR